MSALPLTVLRPLAFPSHTWAALICLRTKRVLALLPATADLAVCAQTPQRLAPHDARVRQVPAKSLPL